jgi:hypothetical protein
LRSKEFKFQFSKFFCFSNFFRKKTISNQAVLVLVGAVVVVQVVAKLSTIKLSRSRLDDPGADPCPTPDPSLPVGEEKQRKILNSLSFF